MDVDVTGDTPMRVLFFVLVSLVVRRVCRGAVVFMVVGLRGRRVQRWRFSI